LSPYSSARAGKVARWDSLASWKKTGQVFASGSGKSAATQRAPSCSNRSTYASAAGLGYGRCPSPPGGGHVSTPTVCPASRGSGAGPPVSADHIRATSSTLRAIGPTVSSVGQSGKMPSIGISPQRGFSPTVPQQAEGRRIEQPVSVPRPRSQRPAASAAALPPLEPPVVRPGCNGFLTVPYHGFWLVTPQANSCRFALPTMTAPA